MIFDSYTDPQGRVWLPFAVDYDSQDATGPLSFYIMATSIEHAWLLLLEDIRETARVRGHLLGVHKQ